MKWFLAIFLVVFVSCEHEIIISEEDIRPDIFYVEQELKPYTGICRIYFHDTEQVKHEFRFKKGRLDGTSYTYYRNGSLRRKGDYKNGLISGKWQNWDEAGNLIMELNYVNDTLNGPYITTHPNGDVIEKGTYSENKRVGEWIRSGETGTFIRNGAISSSDLRNQIFQ